MNNSLHRPMENLIRGMDEHSEHLTREEVQVELQTLGVNVENTLSRAKLLIASSLKKERTAWMIVADSNKIALDAAVKKIISWKGRTEEEIRGAYAAMTAGLTGQQALAFRKQDNLSIEDMAGILDDFELVKQKDDTEA